MSRPTLTDIAADLSAIRADLSALRADIVALRAEKSAPTPALEPALEPTIAFTNMIPQEIVYTAADLRTALMHFTSEHGIEASRAVMQARGYSRLSDVQPNDIMALVQALA